MEKTKTDSVKVHSYTLLSGGVELGNVLANSIGVSICVNKIPTATIYLQDGEMDGTGFELSSNSKLWPGEELTIQLGYDSNNTTVFSGIIVSHSIKLEGSVSYLCLELQHKAIKLAQVRKTRAFDNTVDQQIASDIGQDLIEWNLSGPTFEKLVQMNISDWDFLISRAEANGWFLYPTVDKIKVAKPEMGVAEKNLATLGTDVFEFNIGYEGRKLYHGVEGKYWDYTSRGEATFANEGEVTKGLGDQGELSADKMAELMSSDKYTLPYGGYVPQEELEAFANGFMARSHLSKIKGSIQIQGISGLEIGGTIQLESYSKFFDGGAYISGIDHIWTGGDWRTVVQLGLPSEVFSKYHDVIDEPLCGFAPPISGLQIAKVIGTSYKDASKQEHRIQITLPHLFGEEILWARVGAGQSGTGEKGGHGIFFRPQDGDEVVVGFLNEDPRNPIILGSLYGGTVPGPFNQGLNDSYGEYNVHGIVTPKQIKIQLDDDKGIVTIETPGGRTMILDDDQGQIVLTDPQTKGDNVITMDASGIEIKSAGTIKLDGNSIEFNAKMELKGEGNLLSMNGKSKADYTADGIVTLNGGQVLIG